MKNSPFYIRNLRKYGLISLIGGLTVGAIYLAYWTGRRDEIKEIVNIVADQGSTTMKFYIGKTISVIGMEQL